MFEHKEVRGNEGEFSSSPYYNTGFFKAAKRNNIKALFFGHDHDNDYEGFYDGIFLSYGRKTGVGGYGPIVNNKFL